ncbi:C-type lectin domain family 6 member A-like [Coregonus clupeaformis]|uniref:C-type lectin domain family 6 member A-like n=1 Tax=Coregonus clupeaformis TaxID=59861 RepID=UPI001E1C6810|nr:C-type lectin domain family 6 member A-like [Coregonus clupeaformis]
MSEAIYAKPDMTKKVKFDRGEMEDRIVDIYVRANTLRDGETSTKTEETADTAPNNGPGDQHSDSARLVKMASYINKQVIDLNEVTEENRNRATRSVKTETHLSGPEDSGRRLYRMVAVSFGMLCVLQVTLNISLRPVCANHEDHTCPEGWQKFESSCYFISTEKKTWRESRQDCLERGADLFIVNSDKEQTFINGFNEVPEAWIGLTDCVTEGTWKWVDGTTLTTPRYWMRGDPSGGVRENCVLFGHRSSGQGTWHDYPCSYNSYWICEI